MNMCGASPSLGVRELGSTQGRLRLPMALFEAGHFQAFLDTIILLKCTAVRIPSALSVTGDL